MWEDNELVSCVAIRYEVHIFGHYSLWIWSIRGRMTESSLRQLRSLGPTHSTINNLWLETRFVKII
jgi:hypothetical protein